MLYMIYGLLISALSTSQMAWPLGKMSMLVPQLVVALVEKYNWLVVEPYPSEKYEFVSLDDYSQYMEQLNSCSKPPTR